MTPAMSSGSLRCCDCGQRCGSNCSCRDSSTICGQRCAWRQALPGCGRRSSRQLIRALRLRDRDEEAESLVRELRELAAEVGGEIYRIEAQITAALLRRHGDGAVIPEMTEAVEAARRARLWAAGGARPVGHHGHAGGPRRARDCGPGRAGGSGPDEAAWAGPVCDGAGRGEPGRVADLGGPLGRGACGYRRGAQPGPGSVRPCQSAVAPRLDRRGARRAGNRGADGGRTSLISRRRRRDAAGASTIPAENTGPARRG